MMKTNQFENTPVIIAIADLGTRKMTKILENFKRSPNYIILKPYLVAMPMEVSFEGTTYPTFPHGRGLRQAFVILSLRGGEEPLYFKGEIIVVEYTYSRIRELSFSSEYLKRFETLRRPQVGTIESKYLEYIKEIFNVMYKNVYDKILPLNANISIRKNKDFSLHDNEGLLLFDLLNESAVGEVNTCVEAFEKVSDDEMGSCIIMSSYNFLHPINQLMSPAALALSFWQYSLLGLKKTGREDNYFSKQSLPKVTYIDLTGFFSEINFEMVNALSENIQTILIYDSSTGGPNILKGGCYDPGQDLRARDRNFNQISDEKGLFIPLKSTNSSGQKNYSPNDMLGIFDEIIVRAIEKFKPYMIVLNVSLIFEESSNLPFWLDEKAFGEIVNTLSTLCDGKIIVYPFKLPDLNKNTTDKNAFNELKNLVVKEKPRQAERLDNIFTKYGLPYNENYLKNCVLSILEALAGMRNSNLWERSDIRRRFGTNPIKAETVHQIARYYKNHNYYHFLYSKACGNLARLNQENLAKIKRGRTNKIPIFYNNDGGTTILRLTSQNRKIELNEDSQYFIDYSIPEEPCLYVFNALISDIQYNVAVSSSISNIKLPLEIDDTTQPYVSISDNDIRDMIQFVVDREKNFYKDMSICKIGNFVFQVYGTLVNESGEKKDVTQIFGYDFENTNKFQIKIKGQHNIMPRHSVTTCAFQNKGINYIYIFGGLAQPKTQYNGRVWGGLDIIDIVEIYKTAGPITPDSEWEYKMIPKKEMYKASNASYIPFIQSYAAYFEDQGKIVILGGRMFRDSVQDWSFPIFEFDIAEQRFTSFQVVLNYARNNFARKEVVNHTSNKVAFPIAVADKNINFRMNEENKRFRFIIPTQDDEYIYTYFFDWNTKDCQYEHILHKDEKTDDKTVTLPQNTVTGKSISMPTKISELMNYFTRGNQEFGKLLMKLIEWRWEITEDTIPEERITEKLEGEPKNTEYSQVIEGIKALFKQKDFKDIFINRDNRLQQLKNFILKSPAELIIGEEPSFPKVDESFRKSLLSPEYEDLPSEIKKSKEIVKLCVDLIDWRMNNIQERITDEELNEQIKNLQEASAAGLIFGIEDKQAILNMNSLFGNERLRKMLIVDTDELKYLRKVLTGSIEQSFLLDDSTRDTIYEKDLAWSDLDYGQKTKVYVVLKKAIEKFSKISADKSSFSSNMFKLLEQEIQETRKGLAKEKGSSLTLSLLDTVNYSSIINSTMYKAQIFGQNDSLSDTSRSTAYTDASSRSMLSFSVDQNKTYDGHLFKAKTKEDSGDFSVKHILYTLSTACQQVINVSHMVEKGTLPQIDYNKDLFEKKFLNPLQSYVKKMELNTSHASHDGSTLNSTLIGSMLKNSAVDETVMDGGNANILDDPVLNQTQLQPKPQPQPEPELKPQPEPEPQPTQASKQTTKQPKPEEPILKKTVVQPEVPAVKYVETKSQEIQKEQLSLPSIPVEEEEEKKVDDVTAFKKALSAKNNFRAFFNSSRSELTILSVGKNGEPLTRRLRFKIMVKDQQEKRYIMEDISFENSPSSIWIHNDSVICYVDQTIKIRYPDIYKAFKSCILYADLQASPEQLEAKRPVENLIFKKLMQITQDDQLVNRCLVGDEENLFLLAGKSYRFKRNNAMMNNQVSIYSLKKFTKVDQPSSELKNTEADHLESIKGDSVSVATSKTIFICPRKDPTKMEIYRKDGTVEEEVDLPSGNFKNSFVSMTLVNFRGKDEILFTLHRMDKNREFKLYSIKEKSFEEDEVKLVPKETEEDDKKFQPLYSGFEELESNIATAPIKENIMFYVIRDEEPKFVSCEIKIG